MELNPMDFTCDIMENETSEKFNPIKDYFNNKVVFLTGGTGFLGQLYVEKLLRSDVKEIYLLARTKKNVKPEERLKQIFCGVHFSKLVQHDSNYLQRIRIIEGDLSQINLGITEKNLEDIYKNVQIVLHAAADVRFDEKLIKLLMTNLRGTRELLRISEKIENLEVVSYISTAYSNCHRKFCEEKFYPAPVDPNVMIALAEKMSLKNDTEEFDIITERIIMPWPNTYTYSKSLSEELVRSYGTKFPICIIRPSIVISTYEDPITAWCNNIYGLNGVLVAVGLGVLRLIPMDDRIKGDIICVDFVINSTLAAIWYTHKEQKINNFNKQEPQIYHVNSTEDRPITWGRISEEMTKRYREYPVKQMLWKHTATHTTCPFLWKYYTILYHVIPGFFIDFFLEFKNSKQKQRLLPVYRKVQRLMDALKYFMQREWRFTNTNMKKVWDSMTPDDKTFYSGDVRILDWESFTYNYCIGLRIYIGNESMETVDAAKKKYKKLCIMHFFVLCIYYGFHILMFYVIGRQLNIFQKLEDTIFDTYNFLKHPQ